MRDGAREGDATTQEEDAATRADDASTVPRMFSAPEPVAAVNGSEVDYGPALSADNLTLYFESYGPGGSGNSDIWISTRPDLSTPFGPPINVDGVNTVVGEHSPCVSRDGLRLYFDRERGGDSDIYVATRTSTDEPFEDPVPVTALATDERREMGPHESGDGLRLYLSIELDLAVAVRPGISDEFAVVRLMDEVNTDAREGWPSVPTNELELFFEATSGVVVSTRSSTTVPFGDAVVVPELNIAGANTGDPSVSYDGRFIVFGSDREGGDGAYDIWIASRE